MGSDKIFTIEGNDRCRANQCKISPNFFFYREREKKKMKERKRERESRMYYPQG